MKKAHLTLGDTAIKVLNMAEKALKTTEHGNFSSWYAGDRVFGFERVFSSLKEIND